MGNTSSSDSVEIKSLQTKVDNLSSLSNRVSTLESKVSNTSVLAANSINLGDVATQIVNTDPLRTQLASSISQNPNKIGDDVANKIISNASLIQSINNVLSQNTQLADLVANTLTSNTTYQTRIRGPRGADGSLGDVNTIKSNLFDTSYTLWCADGETCKIPNGKKGIDWGYGGSKIVDSADLTVFTDDNFYVNVSGNNNLKVQGDGVRVNKLFIGGWSIQEEGDHLTFKRGNSSQGDDQGHFRMTADGNLWISRKGANGWVAEQLKDLKDNKIGYNADVNLCHYNGRGCLMAGNSWDARTSDNGNGDWEHWKIGRR